MAPEDDELSNLIRRHATRYAASKDLRASIRTQVAMANAVRERSHSFSLRGLAHALSWRSAVVGFALGVVAALSAGPVLRMMDSTEALQAELVADHIQALRARSLVEVASSDRHTVKPWFQGRIDYAPPVLDFAAAGFPLLGAHLAEVRGSTVAALVYKRREHVVHLFIWPSAGEHAVRHAAQRGFNLVSWADRSMQYWLVSDVERSELERFAQLWRESAPGR